MIFLVLLFFFCFSEAVKDMLENAEDNSKITIPTGYYETNNIVLDGKENIEISTDGVVVIECADSDILHSRRIWNEQDNLYFLDWSNISCPTHKIYASIGKSIDEKINSGEPVISNTKTRNQLITYSSFKVLEQHEFGDGVFFNTSSNLLYLYLSSKDPNDLPNDEVLFISCGTCLRISNSVNITFNPSSNNNNNGIDDRHLIIIDNGGRYAVAVDQSFGIELSSFFIFGALFSVAFFESSSSGIEYSLIQNFVNIDELYWSDFKSTDVEMENYGIIFYSGGSNNFARYCEISGYFNGIIAFSDESSTNDPSKCNRNLAIQGNRIHSIGDDALEIEFCNMDVQVFENIIFDTYTGISLAPVQVGPVYIYQNLFIASKYIHYKRSEDSRNSPKVFKFISGYDLSPTEIKIYHNTNVAKNGKIIVGNDRESYGQINTEFYNNIFYITYTLDEEFEGQQYLTYYNGLSSEGNEYDYNVYDCDYFQKSEYSKTDCGHSFYKYYNSFTNTNGYCSLSSVLSSTAGHSSGYDTHSIQKEIDLSIDDWENPYFYEIMNIDSIDEANKEVIASFPKDDLLLNKETRTDRGCNDLNLWKGYSDFSSSSCLLLPLVGFFFCILVL